MNETRGLWRGKRVDNGEWVQGSYVMDAMTQEYGVEMDGFIRRFNPQKHKSEMFEVNGETLGECTGLTDKNGKLIFEGDIFGFNDEVWSSCYTSGGTEWNSWEVKNYGVVGFDEECARFDFVKYKFGENSVEADLHENRDIEFAEFVSNLEVIGNFHDNPDLLKGENDVP